MRLMIITCLLLATYSVLAQPAREIQQTVTTEKMHVEHDTKLADLKEEIVAEEFKFTLQEKQEPPYSWQATNCEHVINTIDTVECIWHFRNDAKTHNCEDSWFYENGKWYHITKPQCRKIDYTSNGQRIKPQRARYKSRPW